MNQINGGKAATYQHCGVTACQSPQGNQNYAKVYTSPKAAI